MPSQNGIEVKATVSSAGVISSDVTAAGTTVIATITAGAPGKNGSGGGGVIAGGATGQVLGKNSGADDDVSWQAVVNSLNGRTGNVTLAESDITGLTTDLAGKATLASPTFTGTVTLPAPVGATDAATKGYVDATAQGLSVKNSTDVLSDANVVLSGLQTIDGVTMTAGQRVLLTAQTTASQNGIWVVGAGSWTRPADFSSGSLQKGSFTFIISGSVWADTGWVLSNATTATVDTTAQTWTEFSSAAGAVTLTGAQTVTGAKTFNAGALLDKGNIVFDARAYGVVADGRTTADAGINVSTSTTTLNSATAAFSPADVGKGVMVTGAGNDPHANILNATITAYVSATQVTFSPAATHTVSGAKLWVGTNNTTFISNALTAAAGLGYVQLPAGNILHVNDSLTIPANTSLCGRGMDTTFLIGGGMDASHDNQVVSDMTIDGNNNWFWSGIRTQGINKRFDRVHITNWGNFGLQVAYDSGRTLGSTNVYIHQCTFDHSGLNTVTGGSVIMEGGYVNVHIDDCVFGDSTNDGCFMECYTNGSTAAVGLNQGLWFTNNQVIGKFAKAGYALGSDIHILNNVFASDFDITSGIDHTVAGTFITTDVHFRGNTLLLDAHSGGRTVVRLVPSSNDDDSGQLTNVWITENHFDFAQIELTIHNPSGGNTITGLHIEDNDWSDAGASAINFLNNYPVTFDNLHIKNNSIRQWNSGWPGINFNPTGASASMTLVRSQVTGNTFGPGNHGDSVHMVPADGATISGTLQVYDNELNGSNVYDSTGTVITGHLDLSSLTLVPIASETSGLKINQNSANTNRGISLTMAAGNTGDAINISGEGTGKALNINVGQTSLAPGTTGYASLHITSGVAPSLPNTGDVWFDGTHIMARVGASTVQIDQQTSFAFTQGSVAFAGSGGGLIQDNAQFFWDDSSFRLGLGTAAPANRLHTYGGSGTGIRIESSGDHPTLELKGSGGTITLQGSNSGNWFDVTVPGGPTPMLRMSSSNFELHSNAATSGTTLQNSPLLQLYGEYWNGSASTDYKADITHLIQSTTPTSRLRFQINSADLMNLTSAGLLGINQTSPTSYLDLPASTTANASLRLRAGAAPTSPNSGDVYQDGTHEYHYINGTWRQIDQQIAGGGTITNAEIITAASGANFVPLTINQNDTTNNNHALDINNTGTGTSLSVSHTGAAGRPLSISSSSGERVSFERSVGGVDGFNPVIWIDASSATESVGALIARVSNASASGTVAQFQQSGTGKGVAITNSGTANSLEVAKHSALGHSNAATAFADLAASTTSEASLRLRAGTAPTSPNDGDLWNDSTSHHLMARLNGASYQIDQQGGSTSFATLTKFK